MKFKLSMDEVSSLVRTHIEEQYGRMSGNVLYNFDRETFTVDIDDNGPMPDDTPEPESIPSGPELEEAMRMVSDDMNLRKKLHDMQVPVNPDHDKD